MQRLPSVSSWQLLDKNGSGDGNGFSICADDFKGVMRTFSATIHNLTVRWSVAASRVLQHMRVQTDHSPYPATPCYL